MTGRSSDFTPPRPPMAEQDRIDAARDAVLDAMLIHVEFDGWSAAAIKMGAADSNVSAELAALAFPRGGVDAAMAFHRRGDRAMAAALIAQIERRAAAADAFAADHAPAPAPAHDGDQDGEAAKPMSIREKCTFAVRTRLELVEDARGAVRRGASLFALPIHVADGARAIWGTADAIWTAMGDESVDINRYTKRGTLAGVYSATLLFWLADESEGRAETWAFLDRRITDVMRFEKTKAQLRGTLLGKAIGAALGGMATMGGAAAKAAGAAGPSAPGAPSGRRFGFPGPRAR
jgi:ubiquinone biosynthesis protein COQ9